jgi:hypothetical protein
MARIRSVKPDFFRHEGLQSLEAEHPGSYCMLVFEGLWVICDRAGRFEWKPRTIKLDVLPFLEYDITGTLQLLAGAGFIQRYEVQGKIYGRIPSWEAHQTFESLKNEKVRFPDPSGLFPDKSGKGPGQGRDQLGKEREREREAVKPQPRKESDGPSVPTGSGTGAAFTVLAGSKHSRSADLDELEAS